MSVDRALEGASTERDASDAPERKGVLRGGHDPRELARRSVEARKRKRGQQPAAPPAEEQGKLDVDGEIARLGMRAWTDKQLIKLADGGRNAAASVAALKELRNRDLSATGETAIQQAVMRARDELASRSAAIADRRRHADPDHCPMCGQPRGRGAAGTGADRGNRSP